MVAYKAAQSASFIRSPDSKIAAALLYGPEASLVAERARELARNIAGMEQDEAEIIRLDDNDLSRDPGRLAVELQTRSMFAERRIVLVRAQQRLKPEAVSELISGPLAATLIVEAGNLRPGSKLRKIFETGERAAALPCYADAARDMGPLIDAELGANNVRISREARSYLTGRLGSDPGTARSECAKLATYAGTGGEAHIGDIDAVIGDMGAGMVDALAAAAAEGRTREALRHLDALIAGGQGTQVALAALGRHFQRLHRLCASIEAGEPARTAIARFRPPVHFTQRDALLAQGRKWSAAAASRALMLIQNATRATRRTPVLDAALTERLLIVLSRK